MCDAGCCATGCIVADCACRACCGEPCSQCTAATKPVVVLPRRAGKYEQFPRLNAMWDAAYQALADAEELTVFGFSFADTDIELRCLFRRAFETKRLNTVYIIDANPEAVAAKLDELLPSTCLPTISAMTVPPDFSMPREWRALRSVPQHAARV